MLTSSCSLSQVSEMVKKLHLATPLTFGVDLIHELVENFGRCPKWSGRQAFVFVCQVSKDPFVTHFISRTRLTLLLLLSVHTLFILEGQNFATWRFIGSTIPQLGICLVHQVLYKVH